MRVQGWDPVLIICQIICLQTIHYLTLSTLIPPFLSTSTSPVLLSYSGGASTVAHILDWREMASRPTVGKSSFPGVEGWRKLRGAWAGGKEIGSVTEGDNSSATEDGEKTGGKGKGGDDGAWDYGVDPKRGWIIGATWLLACAVDIAPLYYIIRRPTHILDHSLTLVLNHFILTTYYSSSFPTSLFFWLVQALGATLMIVVAEHLCVKREMQSELDIGWTPNLEQGQTVQDPLLPGGQQGVAGPSGGKGEVIELQAR